MKNLVLLLCLLGVCGHDAMAQLFKRKPDKLLVESTTGSAAASPTVKRKKAESWWYYGIFDNQTHDENVKVADLEYTPEGKLEKWQVYDLEGNLDYTYLYEYDPSLNQMKRWMQEQNKNAVLDFVETYSGLGQVIETKRFGDKNVVLELTRTEYNALGQLMKTTRLDGAQQKLYEVVYEYFESPKSRVETHTNYQTKEEMTVATAFNDKNQVTEETWYKSTGELIRKTEYAYDSQNRLVEKKFYRNGKQVDVVETYAYGSLNDEVTHSTYVGGGKELAEYVVYKYEFY